MARQIPTPALAPLWDDMIATDLTKKVPELDIPVYFFEGIYDYTCSYTLAKDYFEKLKAPIKGFYTFEQSAHSPLFEEPEKMRRFCRRTYWQERITLPTQNKWMVC